MKNKFKKITSVEFIRIHTDLDFKMRHINSIFYDPRHILKDPIQL